MSISKVYRVVTSYFKFLAGQLRGWQMPNYSLFFFSLGVQLMVLLGNPKEIGLYSIISFIGTTLSVLCVVAINAAKSVNGILGILSGICFCIMDWHSRNFMAIFEQVAYIITLDFPVLIKKDWNKNMESHIRHFTSKDWVISIASTLVVWGISTPTVEYFTNEPRPIIDGLSFAISLTAGIICTCRFSNQYFWWFTSGLIQVVLWSITLYQANTTSKVTTALATLVNACIFVVNDLIAFKISPWFNAKVRNARIRHNQMATKGVRHTKAIARKEQISE